MNPRDRRFALVGAVTTAVDVGALVGLARGARLAVPVADAVALTVAAGASYGLHRRLTFAGDPYVRWVQRPGAFAATAAMAGAVDLVVLTALTRRTELSAPALIGAKLPAIAVAAAVRLAAYRQVLFTVVRREQVVRRSRPPARGDRRLSVVVPAYGEEDGIGETIERLRAELAAVGPDELEIVVVDDGSTDRTAARARAAGADQVLVLDRNRGKGAAVRAGVLVARGRTIAFLDADLSYAPDHLLRMLQEVEEGWDVVVGSRRHTDTTTVVRAGRMRELGGRAINRLTAAVLLGQYRDTQCGLKAFRADVARTLFARSRVDGFAFDVEIFHLVERDRLSLTEVPVRVANSNRSTVRVVPDAARLVLDLFRIRRWAARGVYDASTSALPPQRGLRHPGGTGSAAGPQARQPDEPPTSSTSALPPQRGLRHPGGTGSAAGPSARQPHGPPHGPPHGATGWSPPEQSGDPH